MDETWSRTDQRRANRVREDALLRLGRELFALGEKKLAELDLPEGVFDAVIGAQRMRSASARNRQLGRLRSLLRESEWTLIQRRVAALLEHGVQGETDDELTERVASWALRLLGEGASGLEAFLEEHPRADRTHFRTLVRNVVKSSDERRQRAERKLREAVASFLR